MIAQARRAEAGALLVRDVEQAALHLGAGGLLAYPTETSWGLAARIDLPRAVDSLRAFKGRDADKPLSLLVSGEAALQARGAFFGFAARAGVALVRALWPGPLTLVLPDRHAPDGGAAPDANAPDANAPGKDAPDVNAPGTGFRCSPHPAAQALAVLSEQRGIGPFTATSLNLSGLPACNDFAAARRLVEEAQGPAPGPPGVGLRILDITECGDAGGTQASTVVDLRSNPPRILREGAISREQLDAALAGAGAASTAR